MQRRAVGVGLLRGAFLGICLILSGCGSNSNPVPTIVSIAPTSVPAGNGQFTLSISGANLNGSSQIDFGSDVITPGAVLLQPCAANTTCLVTLLATIPPGDVSTAGPVQVNVNTASQVSANATFTVTSPQILTEAPMAVPAGAASFSLTLTVLNAAPTVVVQFGNAGKTNPPLTPNGPVTCNLQTACSVTVTVPASLVATAGAIPVTLTNPLAMSGGTAGTNFLVTAAAATGQFPVAESVSGTTPGNASSTHSSTSDGGVFVAFDSTATNLTSTPGNGLSQVYVTQNCFGSGSCTPQTTLISAGASGPGAGGVIGSDRPAISPDGRFVVFESDDTNLATGATQAIEQIYQYDTCNNIFGAVQGCKPALTLISANGTTPGNAASTNPAISAFGLFVAFQSTATNLTSSAVPGTPQIYLYQSCNAASGAVSGCMAGLQLFSTDVTGGAGDNSSTAPSIDSAGIAVAFDSLADNIAPGIAANGAQQVYLRSTCLEGTPFLQSPCLAQTVLVSGDTGNKPGTSDSVTPAATDSTGIFVAYATSAGNLLPKPSANQQILGSNVCMVLPSSVACAPSGNILLSADPNGMPGNGNSSNPAVSETQAVFTSLAPLLTGVTGQQVYAVSVCLPPASCSTSTTLISTDSSGNAITGDFGSAGGGGYAAFSTTGSASAPGTGEIFLAAPPAFNLAPAGATKIKLPRK
ncbi:MAG: IPT/TIG domain-containing protein [Candidatus Acidiferrales bacterium]